MRISDWSSDVCSSDLLALAILDHGHQRPSDRKAGAIERVHEACPLLAGRAATGVHTPRLEIAAVGNGADLAIAPLSRQPDLQIIGLEIGRASCRERVCQYV